MRYELTDSEWAAIKPMLPHKSRGVPRVSANHASLTLATRITFTHFCVYERAFATCAVGGNTHRLPGRLDQSVAPAPPTHFFLTGCAGRQ
jgi:hypothetical protein